MSSGRAQTASAGRQQWFYVVVSGVFLAITLVGFAPSFFLQPLFGHPGQIARVAEQLGGSGDSAPDAAGLPVHVIAHGVLATSWLVLFFVQALLIRSGRRELHQKLGLGGLLVGAGVFSSGIYAVALAIPRLIDLTPRSDPAAILAEQLPPFSADLGSFAVFGVAVAGAATFRHRAETHKQLMLLASMILVPVAISRFWLNSGVEGALEVWTPATENALAVLIIGGLWVLRRRVPWVLLGGFVFWAVLRSAMIVLGSTEAAQSWALGWMA